MRIWSPAFEHNGFIPEKYTCDGENINPSLFIEDVPQKAKSLVLIVDDPDAPLGTFTHWVLFNIPPETFEIKEGEVPANALQGLNDFGNLNYGGPCPPSGVHRYFFNLYALDEVLKLKEGVKRKILESEMEPFIIAQAVLMGRYERK
jgi:Raf kinase inhibitor-like YbhB/YbcL family protein